MIEPIKLTAGTYEEMYEQMLDISAGLRARIEQLEDELRSAHRSACNSPHQPIGGPGCICVVTHRKDREVREAEIANHLDRISQLEKELAGAGKALTTSQCNLRNAEDGRQKLHDLAEFRDRELTTSRAETAALVQLAAEIAHRRDQCGEFVHDGHKHILALAKLPHRLALEEKVAEAVEAEAKWWTDRYGVEPYDRLNEARATVARIKREREQAG